MTNFFKFCLAIFWTLSINADWTLGTVFNKSDLVIEQAWRYGASGKPRTLSSLTRIFKKASDFQHSSIFVKYHIASQGIALRAYDAYGHEVDIFLDGQPTHSVEWDRKKTRIITKFPQKCLVADGPFCARVLVQDVADGKYLANPLAQAHDAPAIFNMIISGSKGSYQVELEQS